MNLTATCLCLLTRTTAASPQVLLGRKKTGFGAGRFVGLGGHVEAGETPAQAAVRETREESGIVVAPTDLTDLAELSFRFPARPDWGQIVSVFGARRWLGEAEESDEIRPEWFPADALPLSDMWDDARYWLPLLLSGQRLRADFTFADDCRTVAGYQLDLVPGGH